MEENHRVKICHVKKSHYLGGSLFELKSCIVESALVKLVINFFILIPPFFYGICYLECQILLNFKTLKVRTTLESLARKLLHTIHFKITTMDYNLQ